MKLFIFLLFFSVNGFAQFSYEEHKFKDHNNIIGLNVAAPILLRKVEFYYSRLIGSNIEIGGGVSSYFNSKSPVPGYSDIPTLEGRELEGGVEFYVKVGTYLSRNYEYSGWYSEFSFGIGFPQYRDIEVKYSNDIKIFMGYHIPIKERFHLKVEVQPGVRIVHFEGLNEPDFTETQILLMPAAKFGYSF